MDNVEAAQIRRDAEITASLIHCASDLVSSVFEDEDEVSLGLQKEAASFLKDWFTRKKPPMEMPKL